MEYNPPAFPRAASEMNYDAEGMTLRDWFAGQVLTGVIQKCANDTVPDGETLVSMFARNAYRLADAMLAERERDQ